MLNFYEDIKNNPTHFRQLNCGKALISIYDCPLENKFQDLWSKYNYIVHVVSGRKIWHTGQGEFDLKEGSCVLIRKGAYVVEQFFDTNFCLIVFFVPDKFIFDVLSKKSIPLYKSQLEYNPVINISSNAPLQSCFNSMLTYFNEKQQPDSAILELKFAELILTLADNPHNEELIAYFNSILKEPQVISLQQIMEENFSYNLKLEEYAELCARSLSSFKRDFQAVYKTTPAKWLLEKRLLHARHLISNLNKTVAEAAFESGFENASHFSRNFSQRFGFSPSVLKQKSST